MPHDQTTLPRHTDPTERPIDVVAPDAPTLTIPDGEWSIIAPLLPGEYGRNGGSPTNNRTYFEGMLWLASTGTRWRDLPCTYGKWNSVFRRYRRWADAYVFDSMLRTLADLAIHDLAANMFDSLAVRAHAHAACINAALLDRPRGRGNAAEPAMLIEETVLDMAIDHGLDAQPGSARIDLARLDQAIPA